MGYMHSVTYMYMLHFLTGMQNQKLCDLISTHVGGDDIEEFCLTLVIRKYVLYL